MIRFFTNRELSHNLEINLAKWKRWSREFLPPDPLGGMQSGYARQYSPAQAFRVYLGGYLVSKLKFTIPESKQILRDLKEWLTDTGFSFDFNHKATSIHDLDDQIIKHVIFIRKYFSLSQREIDFCYTIRGIISTRPVMHQGFEIVEERYVETSIKRPADKSPELDDAGVKILNISGLVKNFADRLGLSIKNSGLLSGSSYNQAE